MISIPSDAGSAPRGMKGSCAIIRRCHSSSFVKNSISCTFKSAGELRALYAGEGIDGSAPVIAYCRIGERSSHTWFVLKYLLGLKNVTNYDGSWTEWGNLVGANVEKGAATAKGQL